MKSINVTFGGWEDYSNYKIDIPDDVSFFFKKGEVGSMKCEDCEHYTTIVETKKYKKWLQYLNSYNCPNIYIDEFHKYSIIRFSNVKADAEFPIIDRKIWFECNNIDFSNYAITEYDNCERIKNVCCITEFISHYNCKYILASRRNAISSDECYSLSEGNNNFNNLYSMHNFSGSSKRILFGKKAKKMWNSIVADILSRFMFDKKYVDKNETFETEKTKTLLQLKNFSYSY